MSFDHLGAKIWHRWTIICRVPETIDALKNNIREAIGEIELHIIDNVLKNWTDRVGYCMTSRGRPGLYFQIKKEILENIQ